jgi:hypothetical protein
MPAPTARPSPAYRWLLGAALVYTLLRTGVHAAYLATLLRPQALPDWVGQTAPAPPIDLQITLDAARRLRTRQPLYQDPGVIEVYQYAPPYALATTLLLPLSPVQVTALHTALHVLAYVGLYISWRHIFRRYLPQAQVIHARALPLWLLFAAFWTDLAYLNIYVPCALVATLLIHALLDERLVPALLWLSLLLQCKPHWAFAAAVPLLLGHRRRFAHLLVGAGAIYLALAAAFLLAVGPEYGASQYLGYLRFLAALPHQFPWRGPDAPVLGYGHAIKQVLAYHLGPTPATLRLANAVKYAMLAPLGVAALRHLRAGPRVAATPRRALTWALALYCAAFLWLDIVWEVTLALALYPVLLTLTRSRPARRLVHGVVLLYALLDPLRLIGTGLALTAAPGLMLPGPYILTDPSVYLPLCLLVLVVAYALLLPHLWRPTDALA